MKKLFASILLLVYFTVSTGFVVSVHYCMNKLDSVALGDNHQEECGKCGMLVTDSMGCCKSDVKVVKMKLDQTIATSTFPDFSVELATPIESDYFLYQEDIVETKKYPLANGPPLSGQDIYLQNCVFRL